LFKIVSESGIASGIRRIEAFTGTGVHRYIQDRMKKIGGLDNELDRIMREVEDIRKELGQSRPEEKPTRPSLGELTTQPGGLSLVRVRALDDGIRQREELVEQATRHLLEFQKKASKERVSTATGSIDGLIQKATTVDGVKVMTMKIGAGSMDELKSLGDTVRSKLRTGVGIIASVIEGKVALVCVVTDNLIKEKNRPPPVEKMSGNWIMHSPGLPKSCRLSSLTKNDRCYDNDDERPITHEPSSEQDSGTAGNYSE
jgi:alanyl-tRNA synthetase